MRHITYRGLAVFSVLLMAAISRADVPGFTMTGFTKAVHNPDDYSIGYTFEATQPITITALGALDIGGNTIATASQPILVKVYWSGPSPDQGSTYPAPSGHGPGGITAGAIVYASAQVTASDPIFNLDGSAYQTGSGLDGFRYHTLDTPVTLPFAPGTTPSGGFYMITESTFGTDYRGAAQNFAAATNLFGPGMTDPSNNLTFHATYDNSVPDDTAGYNNSLAGASFEPGGIFGPNFMVATPEPGLIGLLIACGGLMLHRRR